MVPLPKWYDGNRSLIKMIKLSSDLSYLGALPCPMCVYSNDINEGFYVEYQSECC